MLRKASLSIVALLLMFGVGIVTAHAAGQAAVEQAKKAADSWLRLIDEAKYRESWDQASTSFKDHVTAEQWAQRAGDARKPFGAVISRNFKFAKYSTSLPGAPDGEYVVIQYDTSFENKKSSVEVVTPMLDKDGQWRVSGYWIK